MDFAALMARLANINTLSYTDIVARLGEVRTFLDGSASLTPEQINELDTAVTAMQERRAALETAETRRQEMLRTIAGADPQTMPRSTVVRTFINPDGADHTAPTEPEDILASTEYQRAFMQFVQRGTQIPAQFRANQITTISDTSAVIPTTLVPEIIREMKTRGSIFNKVRRLNVPGGVEFPILDLKPVATWVGEKPTSDDKKATATGKVSFSYYGLECKIAQSILSNIVSLDEFNEMFSTLAAEAMIDAMEAAIVSGNGTGKFKGVTADARIPAANVITLTEDDIKTWATWKKKVFSKMKKAYRSGEFVLAQPTFDIYIDGMVDKNDQPIGRVNYGIDGAEVYRFGGKTVETVEEDIIPSFDDASTGDVFGIFIDWSNYAVNTNLEMVITKWRDEDNNVDKTKALLIADGKILDPYGVLILKKGATAQA